MASTVGDGARTQPYSEKAPPRPWHTAVAGGGALAALIVGSAVLAFIACAVLAAFPTPHQSPTEQWESTGISFEPETSYDITESQAWMIAETAFPDSTAEEVVMDPWGSDEEIYPVALMHLDKIPEFHWALEVQFAMDVYEYQVDSLEPYPYYGLDEFVRYGGEEAESLAKAFSLTHPGTLVISIAVPDEKEDGDYAIAWYEDTDVRKRYGRGATERRWRRTVMGGWEEWDHMTETWNPVP